MAYSSDDEEPVHEEPELIKREAGAAEAEEAESRPVPEEEEEVAEYHPIRVELVQVLLDAIDILERLARGEIDVTRARAEYAEKVELPSRQMVEEAKPSTRASKKASKKKKASQKQTSSSRKRRKKSS